MKQRLEKFLSAENISKAQFADSIKVARAGISHIMSGRNNPSYEFIVNTMAAYPNLNIEWLLNGSGDMYKSGDFPSDSLFSNVSSTPSEQQFDVRTEKTETARVQASAANVPAHHQQNSAPAAIHPSAMAAASSVLLQSKSRKTKKVMIFYDDGTYEEFC